MWERLILSSVVSVSIAVITHLVQWIGEVRIVC